MSIDNSGPAFPRPADHNDSGAEGMSIRDYFAAKALQSVIGHLAGDGLLREECPGDFNLYAQTAYMLADAMMKERSK